ncbi:MAG TPA: hypothetical protein VI757_13130 [Bacteroidia bacterium]|nr:hypothetical protein [Bacteroidia bacterium]
MILHTKQNGSTIFGFFIFGAALMYFFLVQYNRMERLLEWDEADYAKASQYGIIRNAFEQESLSFIQFAYLGIAKAKKAPVNTEGFPPESEDVFLLRHFHHPLPIYYFSLFLNDDIAKQDILLRVSNMLLSFLCACIMFFIAVKSFFGKIETIALFSACLSVAIFITSDLFLNSFQVIHFHNFFMLVSVLFAWTLTNYLNRPSGTNAIWLALSAMGVVCVLETSLFIFLGALFSVFLLKQNKKFKGYAILIILVFLLSTVLIWPGIIKTLGPAKSYAMYAYRIFAMKNVEYENVSLMTNILNIISGNPLLLIIMVAGYVKLIFELSGNKNSDKILLVPGIIGLFYFIAMIPFTLSGNYIFPAAGLLFIGSVPGINGLINHSRKTKFIFTVLCFIYIASIFLKTEFTVIKNNTFDRKEKIQSDMTELKNLFRYEQPLLVDGGHIVQYYFPQDAKWINSLYGFDALSGEFAIRKNYQYVLQDSLLKSRYYRGVFIGKQRNYRQEQLEQLKLWGYKFKELNYYYLFYL